MKLLQIILVFGISGAVFNAFGMEQFSKTVPQNQVRSEKLKYVFNSRKFDTAPGARTKICEQKRVDPETNQHLKYIAKKIRYSSGDITWVTELSIPNNPRIMSTEPFCPKILSEEDSKRIWLELKKAYKLQELKSLNSQN